MLRQLVPARPLPPTGTKAAGDKDLHSSSSIDRFRPANVSSVRGIVGFWHTSMLRNSLLGKSAIRICFTATASPVPQLNALYTDPNAPFPRHSPKRCKHHKSDNAQVYSCFEAAGTHVVFQPGILHRLLLHRRLLPRCPMCPLYSSISASLCPSSAVRLPLS